MYKYIFLFLNIKTIIQKYGNSYKNYLKVVKNTFQIFEYLVKRKFFAYIYIYIYNIAHKVAHFPKTLRFSGGPMVCRGAHAPSILFFEKVLIKSFGP